MESPKIPVSSLRPLIFVLRLSALYDWLWFILLLAMPTWLFSLFSHPLPCSPFLFRLATLPLLVLPLVYLTAAETAQRCPPLVDLSIAMRVTGALGILGIVFWHRPQGALAYCLLSAGDFVWAALYFFFARRAASSR